VEVNCGRNKIPFGEKSGEIRRCSFPNIDYFRNKLLDREHLMTWHVVAIDETINRPKLRTPILTASGNLVNTST